MPIIRRASKPLSLAALRRYHVFLLCQSRFMGDVIGRNAWEYIIGREVQKDLWFKRVYFLELGIGTIVFQGMLFRIFAILKNLYIFCSSRVSRENPLLRRRMDYEKSWGQYTKVDIAPKF